MILRPLGNFVVDGVVKGTIVALDDDGDDETPLWEAYGNWSDPRFFDKSVKDMARDTGITEDRSRMLLTQARNKARQAAGVADVPDDREKQRHRLPTINISSRYLREIADDAWQVLRETNQKRPEFFCFGNALVDLVETRYGITTRVLALPSLRNRLDRLADFIQRGKEGQEFPARAPIDLLEDMLAQANPPVPALEAIVRGPVCRPDGSIVTTRGYDQITGLFLDLGNLVVPAVPDYPSDDDIRKAKGLILEELLVDFPFASQADRANAVSEIITPGVRHMIAGPTPLFDNEAPTPGTGKDLLADIVSYIHTGSPPPAMTEGRSDDEWRKRLTAKLITSPPLILIDNVKRRLDSGALSAALERPIWEDRILGLSKMVSVPILCTWICMANNPHFSDEIVRRVVRVRIDARMENPRERTIFRHEHLRDWVMDNRGELLWAVLVMTRAWVAKGKPKGDVTIGSYERFSETLGGILKVVGIPGFLANRHEVYNLVRTDFDGIRSLLAVWWGNYRDARVGVDQLFNLAKEQGLLSELRSGRSDHGARVSLGMKLSEARDRIIGEYTIKQLGIGHAGLMTYQLLRIDSEPESDRTKDTPDSPQSERDHGWSGVSGGSFSNPDPALETICESCRQVVPDEEVYQYGPPSLCVTCAEEQFGPKPENTEK